MEAEVLVNTLADTFAEAEAKTLVDILVDMAPKAVLDTLAASLLEAKAVTLPHWRGWRGRRTCQHLG